jgi:hypothetical protein
LRFRSIFPQLPPLAPFARAMLCGIGIYYAISLLAAEELSRRGWRSMPSAGAAFYLNTAARAFPYDRRFRVRVSPIEVVKEP